MKKKDTWKVRKPTENKAFVNKKLAAIVKSTVGHAPELADCIYLDGPNFGTSRCLAEDVGIPSANMHIPVPFSDKMHRRMLNADEAKKDGIADVNIHRGFAYDVLVKFAQEGKKFAFAYLDYLGNLNGGSHTRPRLDLDVLFKNRMLCPPAFPTSVLAITCCERNSTPLSGSGKELAEIGVAHVDDELKSPDDRIPRIVAAVTTLANLHDYEAHFCFQHTYGSMIVCAFFIKENVRIVQLRKQLAAAVESEKKLREAREVEMMAASYAADSVADSTTHDAVSSDDADYIAFDDSAADNAADSTDDGLPDWDSKSVDSKDTPKSSTTMNGAITLDEAEDLAQSLGVAVKKRDLGQGRRRKSDMAASTASAKRFKVDPNVMRDDIRKFRPTCSFWIPETYITHGPKGTRLTPAPKGSKRVPGHYCNERVTSTGKMCSAHVPKCK